MIEIERAELLTGLFDHWPDFHDAELLALRLDVGRQGDASLEADIEVAEMAPEVDERGYYKDRQRCRTTLRFGRVLNVVLDGFGYQNVLNAIEMRELADEEQETAGQGWGKRRYQVRFEPIPAFCEVVFLCDTIAVLTAAPVARAT